MKPYRAITDPTGWSYILGPDGYHEGPIRYRWEADEWADEMNRKVVNVADDLHQILADALHRVDNQ